MSEEYRKQKRVKEAQQSKEAMALADDPTDAGESAWLEANYPDEFFAMTRETVKETEEETKEEPGEETVSEPEKKGMVGTDYYAPYGGALSFDELAAYEETQEEIEYMESVTWKFRAIIGNILSNDSVDYSEKSTMIQTAAEVYKMKLTDYQKDKGFFEKVKGLFVKKEEMPDSQLSVIRTKDGGYRWFGYYSNNYMDREKEIISAEAHKEYAAYLKEHPDKYPFFRVWHILGTDREKEADYVEFIDGFMVASGPLTEKEAEQLEKAIAYDQGQTGMSHGMIVLERDIGNPIVITKYRDYEISDLPLANAANGFTGIGLKEVKMTKSKYDRLVATIGKEAAEKVVDQIGDNKEILESLGVESKEEDVVEEEQASEEDSKEVEEDQQDEKEVEEEEKSEIKSLAEALVKELDLETLSEIIHSQDELMKELQDEIKELKKEKDEDIADMIEDKSIGSLLWRKSQSEETEIAEQSLKEDENITPPGSDENETWVSQVFGLNK